MTLKLMDENTKNPTMNDICICPDLKCGNDTFYHTDYNRVFCSKCRREVRNGTEFKGGKLLNITPKEDEEAGMTIYNENRMIDLLESILKELQYIGKHVTTQKNHSLKGPSSS